MPGTPETPLVALPNLLAIGAASFTVLALAGRAAVARTRGVSGPLAMAGDADLPVQSVVARLDSARSGVGGRDGNAAWFIEPVYLDELMIEVMDLMHPLAVARGIRISAIPTTLGRRYVHADRRRLRQVMLCLLGRAVNNSRDGGNVRIACEDAGASGMRITIADDGSGMPSDEVSRLLRPFHTCGLELGRSDAGPGLVLSAQLIEGMDGVIGVDRATGIGTVVWIELPAAHPPHPRLRAESPSGRELQAIWSDAGVGYGEEESSRRLA